MKKNTIITNDDFKDLKKYFSQRNFSIWTHDQLFDQKIFNKKYSSTFQKNFLFEQAHYMHKGIGLFNNKRRRKLTNILNENNLELKTSVKYSSNCITDYFLSKDSNICLRVHFIDKLPHNFGFSGSLYVNELDLLFYSNIKKRKKIQNILEKIENEEDLILWKTISYSNQD